MIAPLQIQIGKLVTHDTCSRLNNVQDIKIKRIEYWNKISTYSETELCNPNHYFLSFHCHFSYLLYVVC